MIVSTYPGTTAVLGELRRAARLDVPVVSAITDLAGLRFWAHPGVDLHTVTHRESIEEVEAIAGPGTRALGPAADRPPSSCSPSRGPTPGGASTCRTRARSSSSPAAAGASATSTGAVEAALEVEESTVLCLSGHNERARRRLRAQFGAEPRVRLLGFTDRMSDLLGAADALVHSTAGLTVLEAQIRGCPVISYGFAVGHIRANNRAYERFGLARVATSPRRLRTALGTALAHRPDPDRAFAALPSPATLALEAKPRERPRPLPRRPRRAPRGRHGLDLRTRLGAPAHRRRLPALREGARRMPRSPPWRRTSPEVGLLIDAPPGHRRRRSPASSRCAG